MLREVVSPAEVQCHYVVVQVDARAGVNLEHHGRRLSDLPGRNNAVDIFACADGTHQRTKLSRELNRPDFLRSLKWNLETRSVFRESSPYGRLHHVKEDSKNQRHVQAVPIFIKKAPLHRRLYSAEASHQSTIVALQE